MSLREPLADEHDRERSDDDPEHGDADEGDDAEQRVSPPSLLSRKTAMIGNARLRNWFQRPVSVTARATSRATKPQRRSIAYDVATPAASPPGTTIESAVETCVTVIACAEREAGKRDHPRRREREQVDERRREERRDPLPRQVLDERPDLAVVRDRRQDERERGDDDAEADAPSPSRLSMLRSGRLTATVVTPPCAPTLPGPGGRDAISPCSGEHLRRRSG